MLDPRAECRPMSQLMTFVVSHYRRLFRVWTLWPNILPVYRLGIYPCLVLQRLRVFHRVSLEGGQHLGMPCLFSFLPLLGPGLPLLFSVIKGIGGCLDHLI